MTDAALIVAAGRGHRLGESRPKQYLPLGGVPILRRTVVRFLEVAQIAAVQVVIHGDDTELYGEALDGVTDARLLRPVTGGESRAVSVARGLEALVPHAPDAVLIHDAARPFVPVSVIQAVREALETSAGAVAALPVVDALWRGDGGAALDPVARDGLWRAQTPQGFRFADILAAHRNADPEAADDVAVARAAGMAVTIVPGAEVNYKITTVEDMARAERDVAAG